MKITKRILLSIFLLGLVFGISKSIEKVEARSKTATVTVKYIDSKNKKKIAKEYKKKIKVGKKYSANRKTITGYHKPQTIVKTIKKNTTITYKYSPKSYKVTVQYLDFDTSKSIAKNTVTSIDYNRKYTAKQVKVNGYTTPSKITKTIKSNQTIVYKYKKIVTSGWNESTKTFVGKYADIKIDKVKKGTRNYKVNDYDLLSNQSKITLDGKEPIIEVLCTVTTKKGYDSKHYTCIKEIRGCGNSLLGSMYVDTDKYLDHPLFSITGYSPTLPENWRWIEKNMYCTETTDDKPYPHCVKENKTITGVTLFFINDTSLIVDNQANFSFNDYSYDANNDTDTNKISMVKIELN